MNILLTGCAGFIGFSAAQALLRRGDSVIGLDNLNHYYDPTLKEARLKQLQEHENFTFIHGDILDRKTIQGAMQGTERVCHLAALAGVRYAFDHPEEYVRTNILGFFNIIDEVRLQKIPGLIYASSSSVYGNTSKFPCEETDRTDSPISLYGMTKKDNELMASTFHHLYATHVTGLRFFTVYGPWGRPDMALFLFTDALLHDRPLQIFGEGKMQRDFTYIDDIVSGIIAAIDRNHDEEIFNLGCGRKEELMEYVHMVEKGCGKEAKKDFLPMQPGDVRTTAADISKARQMLGYDPKTTIKDGVPRFVTWYREYYGI